MVPCGPHLVEDTVPYAINSIDVGPMFQWSRGLKWWASPSVEDSFIKNDLSLSRFFFSFGMELHRNTHTVILMSNSHKLWMAWSSLYGFTCNHVNQRAPRNLKGLPMTYVVSRKREVCFEVLKSCPILSSWMKWGWVWKLACSIGRVYNRAQYRLFVLHKGKKIWMSIFSLYILAQTYLLHRSLLIKQNYNEWMISSFFFFHYYYYHYVEREMPIINRLAS